MLQNRLQKQKKTKSWSWIFQTLLTVWTSPKRAIDCLFPSECALQTLKIVHPLALVTAPRIVVKVITSVLHELLKQTSALPLFENTETSDPDVFCGFGKRRPASPWAFVHLCIQLSSSLPSTMLIKAECTSSWSKSVYQQILMHMPIFWIVKGVYYGLTNVFTSTEAQFKGMYYPAPLSDCHGKAYLEMAG